MSSTSNHLLAGAIKGEMMKKKEKKKVSSWRIQGEAVSLFYKKEYVDCVRVAELLGHWLAENQEYEWIFS